MKRKIAFTLLLVVLAAIGFLGFSIYERLQEKQAVAERIASLPDFELINLKGETFNSREISETSSLIIIYFNTECHFCQAEIRSMSKHTLLLDKANIYLISNEPDSILKRFAEEFRLDSLQTIEILHDGNSKVKELFGVKGVPNTFVYSVGGKLLKHFKGETKAELLYELVNN